MTQRTPVTITTWRMGGRTVTTVSRSTGSWPAVPRSRAREWPPVREEKDGMVGHVAWRAGVDKAKALQNTTAADGFLRDVHACHNVRVAGRRLPFRIGTAQVGWVLPELAAALAGFAEIRADPG